VLYVNGVVPAQTATTSTDLTSWVAGAAAIDNARIGNRSVNSYGETNHFAGAIDDVRIYSRALSAEEVKQLYLSYNPALRMSYDSSATYKIAA